MALRLCLERLIAPKRDRPITVPLADLIEPRHALTALEQVIIAVKHGALTPMEGKQMSDLLEQWLKTVEVVEFSQRLATLEQQVAQGQPKV